MPTKILILILGTAARGQRWSLNPSADARSQFTSASSSSRDPRPGADQKIKEMFHLFTIKSAKRRGAIIRVLRGRGVLATSADPTTGGQPNKSGWCHRADKTASLTPKPPRSNLARSEIASPKRAF